MRVKSIAVLTSLSLIASPAIAQSQAVQSVIPQTAERVDARVDTAEASNLGGGSDTIIGVLAAAIAAGFIVLTVVNNDDDDDFPTSP